MKRLAAAVILVIVTLTAAQCGGTPPYCPVGYVAQQDSHGSWGCYPAR